MSTIISTILTALSAWLIPLEEKETIIPERAPIEISEIGKSLPEDFISEVYYFL